MIGTTSHHRSVLNAKCQVGGHADCKKFMNIPNGDTRVGPVQTELGLVQTELLLDTTIIDLMWAKQAP